MLGREVPRRVARLDVDLDEGLPRRIEQLAVFPGGVARAELGADRQHQIGLGDAGVGRLGAEGAEHAQRQRMGFGKAALAGGGRRHRQPGGLGERGAAARSPGRCARRCRRSAPAFARQQRSPRRRPRRLSARPAAAAAADNAGVGIQRRLRVRARHCRPANPGLNRIATGPGCPESACLIAELGRLHRRCRVVRLHDLLGDAARRRAARPSCPNRRSPADRARAGQSAGRR